MSWRDIVRTVEPYVPGEQPADTKVIKLNTNENPYPAAPGVRELLEQASSDKVMDALRRYPDPTCSKLVNALAAYHGVSPDRVFVGVGSDDVIAMAYMTFFGGDKPVIFPDITYSFYPVWADMLRVPYETVPLDEDFRIVTDDYVGRENSGIVIPNPNAPTGRLLPRDEIVRILDANRDSIVIIDEAYIDFSPEGSSVIDLTDSYDNLLVTRTYSKSRSLAGIRIGYAIGSAEIIKYMSDVKYSYNSYTLNYPAIEIGTKVLEDEEYFRTTCARIVSTRERFTGELSYLGFRVIPSGSNFVFASHPSVPAKEVFDKARACGIYFRYFNLPRIDNYLRITIGRDEDMDRVVEFLRDF